MSNQEIEALEWKLFTEESSIKNKHKSLKIKLKSLQKDLGLTLNSNNKLRIMNEMETIEQDIRNDFASIKKQKETIEHKKSQKRQQEYEKQTKYYRAKAAVIQAQLDIGIYSPQSSPKITRNLNDFSRYNNSINIRLKQLERLLDSLMSPDFLNLAKMVEIQEINKIYLSSEFLSMYQVWKDLDKIQKTIQDCRHEMGQVDSDLCPVKQSNV